LSFKEKYVLETLDIFRSRSADAVFFSDFRNDKGLEVLWKRVFVKIYWRWGEYLNTET